MTRHIVSHVHTVQRSYPAVAVIKMSDSVLATTDSSLPMSRGESFPRLIHPVQSTFLYVKQFAKNRLIQKFDLT